MRAGLNKGELDWTEANEDYLREQWEEFCGVFGYNAFEEADTWWVEWGTLLQRASGTMTLPSMGFLSEVFVEERNAVH